MRRIEPTSRFRKDFKREQRGRLREVLGQPFEALLQLLRTDAPLPAQYQDHALSGNLVDHRDCHVRPDLVLIYRKPDADTLQLVRLGSHSELQL
jgi:mRNA interferase YafQ